MAAANAAGLRRLEEVHILLGKMNREAVGVHRLPELFGQLELDVREDAVDDLKKALSILSLQEMPGRKSTRAGCGDAKS